jgi:hypothetical protein
VEEEPVEVGAVNLGMTPGTGAMIKGPKSLVMEQRGVTMAFETEHALFLPLQEKLVRGAVWRVTDGASLNATGQMLEREWSPLLYMAARAGLVVHPA